MYSFLLATHSLFRWLVLASLIYAIFIGFNGWISHRKFSSHDNRVRHVTATISHIQLILGLYLYLISPIVSYFIQNFSTAIHERTQRFFGLEHIMMMLIAIVLISVGSFAAKRKTSDVEKFKTMAIWYTVALVIIFFSIPWGFSPLTSRPYYRPF
jgi:hypothetical protein